MLMLEIAGGIILMGIILYVWPPLAGRGLLLVAIAAAILVAWLLASAVLAKIIHKKLKLPRNYEDGLLWGLFFGVPIIVLTILVSAYFVARPSPGIWGTTPRLIGLGLLVVMLSMLGFIGLIVKKRLTKLRTEDEQ
jgi:drug/metabolite transporter (DMT)-like permease